jgi:hypothetical protein
MRMSYGVNLFSYIKEQVNLLELVNYGSFQLSPICMIIMYPISRAGFYTVFEVTLLTSAVLQKNL